MKPVLIYKDESNINQLGKKLEIFLPFMKRVAKAFSKLNLGSITPDELKTIGDVKESFIKKRIVEKLPMTAEIGGMKLKREAFENMVVLPDKALLNEFYDALDKLHELHINQAAYGKHKITAYDFFEFKEGDAKICEEALEYYMSYNSAFEIYALTENQLQYFNALKKICDAINEAIPISNKNVAIGLGFLNHHYIYILFENGIFRPHAELISKRPG